MSSHNKSGRKSSAKGKRSIAGRHRKISEANKDGDSEAKTNVSSKASVEEYFAQGMEQYRQELKQERQMAAAAAALAKAEAEAAAAQAEAAREPSWGLLGDVLARQLLHLEMISRACQTDWKWVSMAKRWRHARIIETTLPPKPPPPTTIEYNIQISATVVQRAHTSAFDLTSAATSASGRRTAHKRGRPSRFGHIVEIPTGPRDKCIDTRDLDYNPYDPNLHYTPTKEMLERFLRVRSSVMIVRWRDKVRSRLDTLASTAKMPLRQSAGSSQDSGRSTKSTRGSRKSSLRKRFSLAPTDAGLEQDPQLASRLSSQVSEIDTRIRFKETILVENETRFSEETPAVDGQQQEQQLVEVDQQPGSVNTDGNAEWAMNVQDDGGPKLGDQSSPRTEDNINNSEGEETVTADSDTRDKNKDAKSN